jgi:hypothetical protein
MTANEQFLSNRKRYQPITLPQQFSDEEMARDWTLSASDRGEVERYRKSYRLYFAIQLCAVRLYGRFLSQVHDVSPRIVNYLGRQLELPPSLTISVPDREATHLEHRKNILNYLGFVRFDESVQRELEAWLEEKAHSGLLPNDLFRGAERHLLAKRVLLPGPSVLERLVVRICSEVHTHLFESIYQRLTPDLRTAIDHLIAVPEGEQRSVFNQLPTTRRFV